VISIGTLRPTGGGCRLDPPSSFAESGGAVFARKDAVEAAGLKLGYTLVMSMEAMINRYHGTLLGLAVGDALGASVEFMEPGSFAPVTDMRGGGHHRLDAGQWTDDTSMALCLAASLVEKGGFDPHDQMQRYFRWLREGYMSSTGACFDIGSTVRTSMALYEQTGDPFSGLTHSHSAGNGSLMRLAPIPLFYRADSEMAIHYARESSRTTHGARAAVDACRYFAGLMLGALAGVSKEELLAREYSPVPGLWEREPLVPEIVEVARGSFMEKDPPEISGSGYVVRSLEAALWAFYHSDDFASGTLLAVNLGDDADTTGAVYGQLGGAFYGEMGIPKAWLETLAFRGLITELADQLFAAGGDEAA
jgi:ADP-ribosyl-[dinitrogen reductase] hydrolase